MSCRGGACVLLCAVSASCVARHSPHVSLSGRGARAYAHAYAPISMYLVSPSSMYVRFRAVVCVSPRRPARAARRRRTGRGGDRRGVQQRQTEAGGSRRHTLSFARAGKTLLPMGSQVHTARVQGLRVATITYICSTKDLGRSIRRSPSATSNEAHTTRLVRSLPARTACHTEAVRAL